MLHKIKISTHYHDEMIDITSRIQEIVKAEKIEQGCIIVYSMHTTAGITINENADPDVQHDFLNRLSEVFPWENPQDLHLEGNSAAHLKTSTVGLSQTILVENAELVLGTWQGIYFCEFDGPRQRTFVVKIFKDVTI